MRLARLSAALFLIAFVAGLAASASASDGVKIVDVGLKGYYSADTTIIVRVLIVHADPQPETTDLRVRVRGLVQGRIDRVDTFTQSVRLGANDHQIVGIPVILFHGGNPELEVELAGKDGKLAASDSLPLAFSGNAGPIGIICSDPSVCQQAQSQISFSGSSLDQDSKGKLLKFASLQYPPPEWVGYRPARTIVLAAPLALLSVDQRTALEQFVRQGGVLIAIEDLAGASDFLAAYRTANSDAVPNIVGRGKVFWIPSLASKELGDLYSGANLPRAMQAWGVAGFVRSELDWTRSRMANHFRFPSLAWLLLWLGAYILTAGIGNFVVLRLIDKREWGWVTLPSLSLIFAFAMYFTSATSRPHHFLAEDIAFFWMDDRSALAAVEHGERISSSRGHSVDLSMARDVVFGGDRNGTGARISVNPFDEDSSDQAVSHWDVKYGPPVVVGLNLLQWSYRDLEFYGFERMPGTIHFASPGHLRNETGRNFSQAIFVDKDFVYRLGQVAAGADVDLAHAQQAPLGKVVGNQMAAFLGYPSDISETTANDAIQWQTNRQSTTGQPENAQSYALSMSDLRDVSKKPFDLTELIRAWPPLGGRVFETRSGIFFGFAEEADPAGSLSGVDFSKKGYSVTVVSFERQP